MNNILHLVTHLFYGRLGRRYTGAILLVLAIALLFLYNILDHILGFDDNPGILRMVYLIVVPFVAIYVWGLFVRRVHDMNVSGWYLLLSLAAVGMLNTLFTGESESFSSMALLLGALVLGVLFLWPGNAEDNKYGHPTPHRTLVDAFFNKCVERKRSEYAIANQTI